MGEIEPAPSRRLPKIGEKPIISRRKRWLTVGGVVLGLVCLALPIGVNYLQTHEPGPQPLNIPPPAPPALTRLAIEHGFPVECLTFARDPVTGIEEPVTDEISCEYTGHPSGQPDPEKPCKITLQRVEDDPYSFRAEVAGSDGKPIPLGINPQFTEAMATSGLPAACVLENVQY